MEKLSRIERERLRRQRELLEVAEEIFADKSFHATTLQEISERADFSIGSIYHMFNNKDEIYLALIHMRLEEYVCNLRGKMSEAQDPLEKIRLFIKNKLDYFEKRKPFLRIFLNTTFGSRWDVQIGLGEELIVRYHDYLKLLSGVFATGIKKGIFSGNDPMGMALALEGISNSFLAYWIRSEGKNGPLPDASTLEEILFHGILKTGGKKQ